VLLGIAHSSAALSQAWPPFVLVAALLLIGRFAGEDGLFDAAASRLGRLPGSSLALLLACYGLVLVVTALLNLDTSVVFLTPVLLATARRRQLALGPFLYGSVFMANASSLFLPGSNLTNLLVLSGHHTSGAAFFLRMWPAALAAPAVTAAGLLAIHRRSLRSGASGVGGAGSEAGRGRGSGAGGEPGGSGDRAEAVGLVEIRVGVGLLGALAAAALIVALPDPALPVLAVAIALLAWRSLRERRLPQAALRSVGLPSLLGLFAIAVALGLLARSGLLSFGAVRSAGPAATAGVAALASVALNNLPAAVLLSAHSQLQPGALLLGLNLGPNLAATGSLAVLLWWRAASAVGVTPSALAYSRQGLLLAPPAILAGLLLGTG
jgi:arsenical pump membrane protein